MKAQNVHFSILETMNLKFNIYLYSLLLANQQMENKKFIDIHGRIVTLMLTEFYFTPTINKQTSKQRNKNKQ